MLGLHDEDVAGKAGGRRQHTILLRGEPHVPVRGKGGIEVQLPLRSIEVGVFVEGGRPERQPADVPLRREQDGEVAAVAAANQAHPIPGDSALLEQEIVGGQDVSQVLGATHRCDLPPRSGMAAEVEGQATVSGLNELPGLGDVSSLAPTPAVNEEHRGVSHGRRLRGQKLPADPLPIDGNANIRHVARRSTRATREYRIIGPSSGSSPWKCTRAPGGGSISSPNAATDEAWITSTAASSMNAASAATSAPVAPPTRHEASKTPDRQRPWLSRPCPTS